MIIITLPIIIGIVVIAGPPNADRVAHSAVAFSGSPAHQLSPGQTVYMNACKVCHGDKAQGVPGLGKPLVNNGYIQDSDDAELFNNIAEGRLPDHPLNTTGIMMPARGAQNITDQQVNDVMDYLRTIQDPAAPRTSMDDWVIERTAPAVTFDGPGRNLYVSLCSSCHGPNGEGMEGLGKGFIDSQFVKDSTDKEIITLVKMGRPIWDPANTTGIDMPPKGGNPAMSDEDLDNIITYMRAINTLD
ncbi:MAG: c-type cytochrome [Phycisphaerales bacterium]|nr:c-type cytochrome [Phycisphaerales bacterium]